MADDDMDDDAREDVIDAFFDACNDLFTDKVKELFLASLNGAGPIPNAVMDDIAKLVDDLLEHFVCSDRHSAAMCEIADLIWPETPDVPAPPGTDLLITDTRLVIGEPVSWDDFRVVPDGDLPAYDDWFNVEKAAAPAPGWRFVATVEGPANWFRLSDAAIARRNLLCVAPLPRTGVR